MLTLWLRGIYRITELQNYSLVVSIMYKRNKRNTEMCFVIQDEVN